ncbi:MAG TPA: ribonuclease PH [Syntrophales bacterium]|nr:ribonuclease PH [Syntrophales bacterium]
MRTGGRKWDEIRPLTLERNYLLHPRGSVLIGMGATRVICTASLEEGVPPFLKNTGKGWLTSEYSMLPMATPTRKLRDSVRGRIDGRTHEIQRLIGRSLRAVTDLDAFGERTLYIDCDVIQADGGTRTAAITGSFIALVDAFRGYREDGLLDSMPVRDYVAALSIGVVGGEILLDLDYGEDSRADVDMNFIMTGGGKFIEIQGTAEQEPFDRYLFDRMWDAAAGGIARLIDRQREILGPLHP